MAEPNVSLPGHPDLVQQTLKTQFPQLEDELQRAIESLKRLQSYTGSLSGDAQAPLDLRAAALQARPNGSNGQGAPMPSLLDPRPQSDPLPSGQPVRVLVAGETFGHYQITRPLGKGAMGAVYLAYDPQLHRYVALKTPFLGDNPQVVQRFLREARSAAQIRSPYVCPIYEVGNVAGILYLSMAFIEGQSLDKWIRDGEHTLDAIVAVFRKITMGIHKAHSQGIIHRDLKPENIMIDSDHEPIIMDFGLARRVNDEISSTAAGSLLGTPAYMSPEQVGGDQSQIGPASDIYSLGVVLYEMLTGTIPFKGSLMSVLHKIVNEEPVPPSAHQPSLTPGSPIEKLCLKLMAKKQAERFSSASEVLAALEQPAGQTMPTSATARPSMFKSMWQRSGKLLASMVGQPPILNATLDPLNKPADSSPQDPSIASTLDPTNSIKVTIG